MNRESLARWLWEHNVISKDVFNDVSFDELLRDKEFYSSFSVYSNLYWYTDKFLEAHKELCSHE